MLSDVEKPSPGFRNNLAHRKPVPPGIEKTRLPDAFVSPLQHQSGRGWRQGGAYLPRAAGGSLVITDRIESVPD